MVSISQIRNTPLCEGSVSENLILWIKCFCTPTQSNKRKGSNLRKMACAHPCYALHLTLHIAGIYGLIVHYWEGDVEGWEQGDGVMRVGYWKYGVQVEGSAGKGSKEWRGKNARGAGESVLKHCSLSVALTFPCTLVKDNVPQLYIIEIHDISIRHNNYKEQW